MNALDEITRLRGLDLPALRKRYREAFGKEPATRNRARLWKELAWKLQADQAAEAAGGRVAAARAETRFRIAKPAMGNAAPPRKPGELPVGTVLIRPWRGRELHLKAVEGGYELDGVVYRTMSAAAKAVTGAHWNGRLFFGITGRKRRT